MMPTHLIEEELTRTVIGVFYEVYNTLGFGFLEHLYEVALEKELTVRGRRVDRQVSVPVYYKQELIGRHRIDMIVDERLIVEVKSTRQLPPNSKRQLYGYLKATNLEVGLLLHFGLEAKFYRQVNLK